MFLYLYPTQKSRSILAWAPTVALVLWGPGRHQFDGIRDFYTIVTKCKRPHLKHLLWASEWGLSVSWPKTRHFQVVVAVWMSLSLTWFVNSRMQCSGSASPTGETIASRSCCKGTNGWNTVSERNIRPSYSSSPAMRNPRMKSLAFCRSCCVCLPIMFGGGLMRRLANSVAKTGKKKVSNGSWQIQKKDNMLSVSVLLRSTHF